MLGIAYCVLSCHIHSFTCSLYPTFSFHRSRSISLFVGHTLLTSGILYLNLIVHSPSDPIIFEEQNSLHSFRFPHHYHLLTELAFVVW